MEPNEIKLYCSHCDPSRWIVLPRDKVVIRLNLDQNQYEFEATCHICGGDIFNARSMYCLLRIESDPVQRLIMPVDRKADMKRYNFDQVPANASGYAVHAKTKKAAMIEAKDLALKCGYGGELIFRDNEPCINSGYFKCDYCHRKA